jgi:hypothetical protein
MIREDFESMKKEISKYSETGIAQEYFGHREKAVIGFMNLGRHRDVELYWFDLLEQLVKSLKLNCFMADGSSTQDAGDMFDNLRKTYPGQSHRARAARSMIEQGILSALEAIYISFEPEDSVFFTGLEEDVLFRQTFDCYKKVGAPENRTRINYFKKALAQMNEENSNISELKLKRWQRELRLIEPIIKLEIRPGQIKSLKRELGADPANLLDGAEVIFDRTLVEQFREAVSAGICFYDNTEKRSEVIGGNIIKNLNNLDTNKAVVSVTGFHWEHITPLLQNSGFSYFILHPKTSPSTFARNVNYGQDDALFSMDKLAESLLSEVSGEKAGNIWDVLYPEEQVRNKFASIIGEAHTKLEKDPISPVISAISKIYDLFHDDVKAREEHIGEAIRLLTPPIDAVQVIKGLREEFAITLQKHGNKLKTVQRELFPKAILMCQGNVMMAEQALVQALQPSSSEADTRTNFSDYNGNSEFDMFLNKLFAYGWVNYGAYSKENAEEYTEEDSKEFPAFVTVQLLPIISNKNVDHDRVMKSITKARDLVFGLADKPFALSPEQMRSCAKGIASSACGKFLVEGIENGEDPSTIHDKITSFAATETLQFLALVNQSHNEDNEQAFLKMLREEMVSETTRLVKEYQSK